MRSDGPSDMARLALFSDVVFGITLTFLVIDIPIPASYVTSDALHAAPDDVIPELMGFGISFAVIAVLGRPPSASRRFDGGREPLLWMNPGFLLCVAFLAYRHTRLGPALALIERHREVDIMGGRVIGLPLFRARALPFGEIFPPPAPRRAARQRVGGLRVVDKVPNFFLARREVSSRFR